MTTNHTELCERLRDESGIWRSSSTYEAAANLIESQAARIAELEKERDALKADAERWRIIESTLPTDELQDIAVIVAAEHRVNVANGFSKAPADLLDTAVAALQAEKEMR